jgi:photosystem II stability/assembly factor-like uncharacterized protein
MAEQFQDINTAKSSQFSIFVQPDGSSPANSWVYVGCLSLGGFTEDLGTGEPIYCPSSEVPGVFNIVDTTTPPSALPTTDFTQHMSRLLNDFWWDLRKRKCEFNFKVKGSDCARPDDPDDFQAEIIAKKAKVTNFTTGAFHSLGEDAVIDLTGSLLMRAFDRFLPIQAGEVADTSTFSEALDGMYADKVQCGNCGDVSDGCQKAYVLTTTIAASPALAAQVVHTTDGGKTWATDNVNTLGTQAANALAHVGTRIVVVSQVDLAHHYKPQSSIDANVASGWTRQSSGYVTSKGPNAIWSRNPNQTFIAAQGGYVYFMSNPTAAVTVLTDGSVTTQNLKDIRGAGRTLVAVGASNAVIYSNNDGATWTLVTGPAVGVTLNTVEVTTPTIWYVGAANGKSFYTTNSGTTWTEMTPDSSITDVPKIRFVDEIVGYMLATLSGSNRLYRTADNGNTWRYDGSYVSGLPSTTVSKYDFVSPCPVQYNNVLLGGLKTPGTDGIIVKASA